MTLDEAKGILGQALCAPIGLVIRTNDTTRARQRFYAAQKQMPEASDLQFRGWARDDAQLIIVKRRPGLPPALVKELL